MMLGSVLVIMLCLYFYSEMQAVGQLMIWALIPVALVCFVTAFVGFTAAYVRSRGMLVFNGILLIGCTVFFLLAAILVFWIGNNTRAPKVVDYLEESWKEQVQQNPKMTCYFMDRVGCSGFNANSTCNIAPTPEYCPANCAANSLYGDSCYAIVMEEVEKWYGKLGAAILVMFFCMLIGVVNNWVLCCSIKFKKDQMNKRIAGRDARAGKGKNATSDPKSRENMRARTKEDARANAKGDKSPNHVLMHLTKLEVDQVKVQYEKYMKKMLRHQPENKQFKSKELDKANMDKFYRAVFRNKGVPQQEWEDMKKISTDTDGNDDTANLLDYCDSLWNDPNLIHPTEVPKKSRKLNAQDKAFLQTEFKKIDSDGSGKLSKDEIYNFVFQVYGVDLSEQALNDLFNELDKDKSGDISFEEFANSDIRAILKGKKKRKPQPSGPAGAKQVHPQKHQVAPATETETARETETRI
jgi:hypothetical protein